jgi:Glyoxalase/Bleomycin resistance protein/Dioxygenase superfamily
MDGSAGAFGPLFQIGYVTRNIQAGLATLDGMGASRIDLFEDYRDSDGNPVMIRALSHLMLGDIEIELIEPRPDWPSVYLDALPDRNEQIALHHLGYRQPDVKAWEGVRERALASGLSIAMEGATPRARFAYLDTCDSVGHFTEIVFREESASV